MVKGLYYFAIEGVEFTNGIFAVAPKNAAIEFNLSRYGDGVIARRVRVLISEMTQDPILGLLKKLKRHLRVDNRYPQ